MRSWCFVVPLGLFFAGAARASNPGVVIDTSLGADRVVRASTGIVQTSRIKVTAPDK